MKPTLLILAAGMGSRYGGLKQIDEVGPHGETIIDYSMYDAIKAGFGKIVFVIRREFEEAFRAKFGHIENYVDVAYAYQEVNPRINDVDYAKRTKPRGTGHAILSAKEFITDPFLVISADDYYGNHAFDLAKQGIEQYVDNQTSLTFCYKLHNTLSKYGSVNRGVCEVRDNFLVKSIETLGIERYPGGIRYPHDNLWSDLEEDTPVAMLMYGVDVSFLDILEREFVIFVKNNHSNQKAEFHFPNVLGQEIEKGNHQSRVLINDDLRSGVSYQDDKPLVQKRFSDLVNAGVYPSPLRK